MADWIRRRFDAVGVTQSPPGPHLAALQAPYLGKVLLCIDVSGSMAACDGGPSSRLRRAVAGAERFIAEAVAAHYQVGLVLWDHDVARAVPLAGDPAETLRALAAASIGGGTNLTPTLRLGIRELGHLAGDRVMAIFGDGDVGPLPDAVEAARRAADLGIRIIVRGLGENAAHQLSQLATDPDEAVAVIRSADGIEGGVAAMAASVVGGVSRRR
jgi:predicted metal-dependent peptidase